MTTQGALVTGLRGSPAILVGPAVRNGRERSQMVLLRGCRYCGQEGHANWVCPWSNKGDYWVMQSTVAHPESAGSQRMPSLRRKRPRCLLKRLRKHCLWPRRVIVLELLTCLKCEELGHGKTHCLARTLNFKQRRPPMGMHEVV